MHVSPERDRNLPEIAPLCLVGRCLTNNCLTRQNRLDLFSKGQGLANVAMKIIMIAIIIRSRDLRTAQAGSGSVPLSSSARYFV